MKDEAEAQIEVSPSRLAMHGGGARALRRLATTPIRVYQRWVSPALPRRCRYEPTCSRYALESIETFGILRGGVLAAWRLLRCNPWSAGGLDPVSAQRLFATRPPAS